MTIRSLMRLLLIAVSLSFCFHSVATGQLTEQLRSMAQRRKADDMLKRARQAIDDGNLALAEWYIDRVDRMEVKFETMFGRLAETPEKLRAEIAQRKTSEHLTDVLREDTYATNAAQTIPDKPDLPGGQFVPTTQPPNNLTTPPKDASPRPNRQESIPAPVSPRRTEPVVESPKAKARRMLARSWAALGEGNVPAAVGWYRSAVACEAEFAEGEFSPDDLAAELRSRGVDVRASLAKADAQPAVSPKPREPVENEVAQKSTPLRDPAALAVIPTSGEEPGNESEPPSDPALLEADSITSSRLLQRGAKILSARTLVETDPTWKQHRERAVALLAEAQAALHRDNLAVATQLVKQANDLAVPDAAYQSGDLRPWMLQMEIDKRQKRMATARAGVSSGDQLPAENVFSPPPMPVQHALPQVELAESPVAPPTGVATAEYPQTTPHNFAQRSVGRPAAAGLVYDPLHDETRNMMASGQQALPMPEQSATTPATPNAATPFPIQGIPRGPADGDAMLLSPSGLPAPTGPQAAIRPPPVDPDSMNLSLPGLELQPEALEPTLAQPTPAAPYGTTADGSLSRRDRSSARDSLSDSGPEGRPANAPSGSDTGGGDSLGYPLFRDGQEALGNQDFGRAAELFREAWQYESELDPETRQALQDNLQIVRSRQAQAATREVDPVELSPTPDEQRVAEQFINELSRQQATARALRQSDPTKAWDELKKMRQSLEQAQLDDNTRQQLLQRVDRQIDELDQYVNANRSRIENDARNQRILEEIDRRRATKARNQQQLAELVDQFNELMDQQRFPEASIVAKKARELDPLNPVVETMMYKTNIVRQLRSKLLRDEAFNRNALATYNSIDEAATPMEGDAQVEFPRYWEDLTKRRKRYLESQERRYTEVELEIRRSLQTKVDVKFENMPLGEVVDKLAKLAGVNAYLDPEGLASEGVASDTTVNISLRKPVSLKSALNLILQPLHLSYVVQDEVLRITSEQVRQGDVHTQVYPVADLVIPVPNFFPSNNVGLPGAIREAYNVIGRSQTLGGFSSGGLMQGPLTLSQDETQPDAPGGASVLAQMAAGGLLPVSSGGVGSHGLAPAAAGGASQADFDTLIDLIQTTVEPDSWEELGGQGAIDGFQGNLSLVVSQTQDVHEQIADLLEQLRRLQDLQVTIEVRFISLNDDFFERIGVDFDFDIRNNSGRTAADVSPLNAYDGPNITIGLDPNGMPTADLDIPFTQGSFASTIPTFGGFDPNSAATIGFAILSDIEAFFLIQAAQGDSRTNVLQAPKVTLFNGQAASVQDQSQVPFVTSVIPVVGDFAAAQQPVITVLSEGTSLNVRAVVSQDRRFIRLDLVPFFSEIGDVDTFTFEGRLDSDSGTVAVDPTDDTSTVVNNQLNNALGTTVQLPTLAFTTVNTTVSVPDGGTILLGGIKRLREGRNEQGVPMLSKLPYINRLFTNVGIGRETQSLMMMVTPRIIIQEEEERKLLEGN